MQIVKEVKKTIEDERGFALMLRYATCAARASSRLHTLQFAGALLSIYQEKWSATENGNMKTASARRKIVRAELWFDGF